MDTAAADLTQRAPQRDRRNDQPRDEETRRPGDPRGQVVGGAARIWEESIRTTRQGNAREEHRPEQPEAREQPARRQQPGPLPDNHEDRRQQQGKPDNPELDDQESRRDAKNEAGQPARKRAAQGAPYVLSITSTFYRGNLLASSGKLFARRYPAGVTSAPAASRLEGDEPELQASPSAEAIRLRLADAWGEMGAAWGVAPAIARVQAYLLTRQEPLTEREVREALNLSHRAASLALAEAESWGLIERVAEPRRVGRRGPAGAAYQAVGDHWRWFGRVVAERKSREGDPILGVLERTAAEAQTELKRRPDDRELAALHEWLTTFLVFVRLFDRAVGLVPRLQPRELERGLRLLGEVNDDTVLRLVGLLEGLDDNDVLDLVDALSRLSPKSARRATKLMSGVVRTVVR